MIKATKQITRHVLVSALMAMSIGSSAQTALAMSGGSGPFLDTLFQESAKNGVSQKVFEEAFREFKLDPTIRRLRNTQPEFVSPIGDYISKRVTENRIETGQLKLRQFKTTLSDIQRRYGVPPEIILSIWGNETNYGSFVGGRNVIHSIASLIHEGYREKFFRKELIAALLITQNGHIRSREMQGSWAGAMGQTQFMPTSFKAYAVDYDGDGRKDIWTSYEDAFASTANYLQRSGWQKGQPWGWEVRLPSRLDVAKALKINQAALIEWEKLGIRRADGQPFHSNTRTARLFLPAGLNGPAFLVLKNFDVIKRYNNSDSYALAVAYLGDRIRGSAELRRTWPVDAIPISRSETRELQTRLGRLGYRVGDQDGRVGPLTRISVLQFQKRNGLIPDAFPGREVLEQVRQRSLPTTGGN